MRGELVSAVRRVLLGAKGAPMAPRAIRVAARVGEDETADLDAVLRAMVAGGELIEVRGGRVVAAAGKNATGTFSLAGRGFGFVKQDPPSTGPDLYVPPDGVNGALPGDRVRVLVIPERREKDRRSRGKRGGDRRAPPQRSKAVVVEVLARAREVHVGTVRRTGGITWLDGPGLPRGQEAVLGDGDAADAKPGDRVVARLVSGPAEGRPARMAVARVLGAEADPRTDAETICQEFGARREYPEAGLAQAAAARAPVTGAPPERGREDCRALFCCTVDPPDAKDFDDAVSLEPLDDGWMLGVHIADVARHVPPGSPCDREASLRGNTWYLLDQVVHMLPAPLAADICSLKPGVDREALTAWLTLDREGQTRHVRIAKTLIHSRHRLTYDQVQTVLDGGTGDGLPADTVRRLHELWALAQKITRRRIAEGALELDLPEVDVVLDTEGRATGVKRVARIGAYRLVEEFMLAANRAVAGYLAHAKLPYLARVHPEPQQERLARLAAAAKMLGFRLDGSWDRFALQALADQCARRRNGDLMGGLVLRSLEKARYLSQVGLHFALGWTHYTHFTSPIRRYADTRVHQILTAHLAGHFDAAVAEDLPEVCARISLREVQAETAERELTKLKVLRLIATHIGEVVPGRVTAIVESGCFVEIVGYYVEGLVPVEALGHDHFEPTEDGLAMLGERSGKRIKIGDELSVRIAEIDLARRQLDLALA